MALPSAIQFFSLPSESLVSGRQAPARYRRMLTDYYESLSEISGEARKGRFADSNAHFAWDNRFGQQLEERQMANHKMAEALD